METCTDGRRCLICRRVTPENSPTNSQKLISNATLLQDFLNCFHINVSDSKVHDLSTLYQFCPTCEQFIAEFSSIQTQMTQLTRRAAQLKATLSALLLSAPEILKQNLDEDVTDIINSNIRNPEDADLQLLLQQTVDDIRSELRKKYLVNVMLNKTQLPCRTRNLNQEELSPLSGHSDNDSEPIDDESHEVYLPNEDQLDDLQTSEQKKDSDHALSNKIPLPPVLKLEPLPDDYDNVPEPSGHWKCGAIVQLPVLPKVEPLSGGDESDGEPSDPLECGAHVSEEEYLPSEDEFNDVETLEQFLEMRLKTEEDANYDEDFPQESLDSKEMNVKAGTSEANGGPSKPYDHDKTLACLHADAKNTNLDRKRKRTNYTAIIPNGPNRFKYNGYDIRLNDEDQCYYCGVCNMNCGCVLNTVLGHIRDNHYTPEDKIRFTAVKTSDTEWLYGGKYKITQVNENRFMCASCGAVISVLQRVVNHIRSQHVVLDGADKVLPVPVTDTPSVNDLTPIQEELESVPYTFDPADNKFTCGLCGIQFSTFNNLSSHIRQSHSAPPRKVVHGKICGVEPAIEKADGGHNMKRHKALPLKCPTCFKQFLSKWTFKQHMAVHELGEGAKKHKCEICGKRFMTLQHCRDHQRLHTGEKPYECQICGQKFPGSSYLTKHRKSAHGIQPEGRRVVKVRK